MKPKTITLDPALCETYGLPAGQTYTAYKVRSSDQETDCEHPWGMKVDAVVNGKDKRIWYPCTLKECASVMRGESESVADELRY